MSACGGCLIFERLRRRLDLSLSKAEQTCFSAGRSSSAGSYAIDSRRWLAGHNCPAATSCHGSSGLDTEKRDSNFWRRTAGPAFTLTSKRADMSRFRRVVHSVASGYVVLVTAALYALAILPLGLHFL